MESQLGMTFSSYFYREFKPSNDKNERHIDRVMVKGGDGDDEEDEDDWDIELVKPVNQYMTPPNPGFEVVSVNDQYGCHDWAYSRRLVGIRAYQLMNWRLEKDPEISLNVLI